MITLKKQFAVIPLLIFCLSLSATNPPTVLVSYYSKTGNTQALAEAVGRGVMMVEGVQLVLKTIEETTEDDLLAAGAIIVGSPVYNAIMAPQVQSFMLSWPFHGQRMKDKLGAAFVTAGGISAGEETAMLSILKAMLIHNMVVVGGDHWTSAFGASAIVEEGPFGESSSLHPDFIEKGERLGKRVAELLVRRGNE